MKSLKTTKISSVANLTTSLFIFLLFTVIVSTGLTGRAYADTQYYNSKQAAASNCSSGQTPTKGSGSHQGKWYCKGNPTPPKANPTPQAAASPSQCGAGNGAYTPSIDLGCKGKGNPILDMTFGIIHFLSDGVGIVVIGSIIVGGLQYTGSRGDPQSTAMAVNRIRSSVFALVLFLFAYAIINYIIPGFVL